MQTCDPQRVLAAVCALMYICLVCGVFLGRRLR